MGVLAPGSAHSRPSARPPINTGGNFPAHCRVTFKHLPQPLRSHIRSFGTLEQLFGGVNISLLTGEACSRNTVVCTAVMYFIN
jgi:hypothetical protein